MRISISVGIKIYIAINNTLLIWTLTNFVRCFSEKPTKNTDKIKMYLAIVFDASKPSQLLQETPSTTKTDYTKTFYE